MDQPYPHQSLVPTSLYQPRDETIKQLEQNSERAVDEELERLEDLSMEDEKARRDLDKSEDVSEESNKN